MPVWYIFKYDGIRMNNNKFDYLIIELTDKLTNNYLNMLSKYSEFKGNDVDTAPLLNLTFGVFVGSLVRLLDVIKESTEGEDKLIKNIELARSAIIKAIEDLPFITQVEFF